MATLDESIRVVGRAGLVSTGLRRVFRGRRSGVERTGSAPVRVLTQARPGGVRSNLRRRRGIWQGALLALGAPLGWLALELLSRGEGTSGIFEELRRNAGLYAYLLVGSMSSFVIFGARLGTLADRLAESDARHAAEAMTDGLTGLYNRRFFERRLAEEVARSKRTGEPFALVMLDLDRFKALNDRHGHAAGDRALERVGEVLRSLSRAADVACRIGGEELALLCPATTAEDAGALAERIRSRLEETRTGFGGAAIGITASFGIAGSCGEHTPEELFRLADGALYAAKDGGRNRVVMAG